MATKFLRKRDVAERYGVTTRSVERMVADKRLPLPTFPLRNRIPMWPEEVLDESDRAAAAAPRTPGKRASV